MFLSNCGVLCLENLNTVRGWLIVGVILAIMRFNSNFVSTIGVCVRFNITMTFEALKAEKMQVMQMRTVTHRLHCGIEPNMITSVERPDGLTNP